MEMYIDPIPEDVTEPRGKLQHIAWQLAQMGMLTIPSASLEKLAQSMAMTVPAKVNNTLAMV